MVDNQIYSFILLLLLLLEVSWNDWKTQNKQTKTKKKKKIVLTLALVVLYHLADDSNILDRKYVWNDVMKGGFFFFN